ncbi:MAG: CvpA family protein [Anaeromyxobacteraceae bacterium]
MTNLDLACLAMILLSAGIGAFMGALAQLASAGATAVGWAGARWLAPHLVPLVRARVPAFAAHPVASLIAFGACAGVAALVLRALAAALGDDRGTLGRVDRGLGAIVGGAKAGVVLWIGLSALALWGRPLRFGPVDLDPTGSDLVAFAREHNALGLGLGRANAPAPAPASPPAHRPALPRGRT